MAAKPIRFSITLSDGTPEGPKVVERSQWTGTALVVSRFQYPLIASRAEFDRPGVYILVGPNPDANDGPMIYIGHSDVTRDRISKHAQSKDFWTHLVLFTNADKNINNAHFRYIESRLVEIGTKTKRRKLVNGNQPTPPQISEADMIDAEQFLETMLLVYPLVGVDAFEQVQGKEPITASTSASATSELVLIGRGVKAQGTLQSNGLLVRSGSEVTPNVVPSFRGSYKALREQLIDSGTISETATGKSFAVDYLFASPSAAASVIWGRVANGPLRWKSTAGKTLREIEAVALGTEN